MTFNDFFSIYIYVIYWRATVVDKELHSLMNTAFVSSKVQKRILSESDKLQCHFEYIDFQKFFLCNIILSAFSKLIQAYTHYHTNLLFLLFLGVLKSIVVYEGTYK